MSYYELMVLFSATQNEQEEKDQSHQVEELLKRENATIHFVDHWGKRKLAYPIKKQRQGIYDWFYFEMDPARTSEVDRRLKMSEAVLRFMLLKMEKSQVDSLHKEITRRSEAAAAAANAAAASAAAASAAATSAAAESAEASAAQEAPAVPEAEAPESIVTQPEPEAAQVAPEAEPQEAAATPETSEEQEV